MAKRKRYDDKFRASAVVMLEAAGYPETKGALTHVAEHLKVPAMTLSRWFHAKQNPAPNELVTEKRTDFLSSLKGLAQQLVTAMPAKIDEASLQQQGTVLGIVLDKIQLLEGKATERIEHDHVGLTDDDRVARLAALADRARARGVGLALNGAVRTDD